MTPFRATFVLQVAAQQELQQRELQSSEAIQKTKQTSEAELRQIKLQQDQTQQQLTDARRARNTAEVEIDSLRVSLPSSASCCNVLNAGPAYVQQHMHFTMADWQPYACTIV